MRRHVTVGFAAALFVAVVGSLLLPAMNAASRRSAGLPLGGGTTVSGVIDVNTTWSVGGSPFIVTGNLLVAAGARLTIEPGVEVRFDGDYLLRVDGELVGDAVAGTPIRFTSNTGTPMAGSWKHILFSPTSVPAVLDVNDNYVSGSILRNVEISFGEAIVIRNSYPYLEQLWIHDCSGLTDSAPALIGLGVINFQATAGSPAKLVLRDSTLQSTTELPDTYGMVLTGNGATSVLVTNNTLSQFGQTLQCDLHGSLAVRIAGNRIENGGRGMNVGATGGLVIEDNRIVNCGASVNITGAGVFRRNLVQNCGQNVGLAQSTAVVTYNSFIGNGGPASYPTVSIGSGSPTIQHNNFEGNGGPYDVYLSPSTRNDVDGRFNYWGTTDPMVIASRIFDENDDFVPGAVDFSGFLTSREPLAPSALILGATVGVYSPSTGAWFLRNSNSVGSADIVFTFGAGGGDVVPVVGDWNGDHAETPGLYSTSTGAFFLRNSNSPGPADSVFTFGAGGAGVVPLVGDWNGDGTDTIGIYIESSGTFFLRNSNSPGPADLVFSFGAGGPGVVPVTGDWDSDGTDSVGIYVQQSGVFFLTNSNTSGGADITVGYGPSGVQWLPVVGDFDKNGGDSIGLYDPVSGFFFLRNQNAPGPADLVFGYGPTGVIPLIGDWDGL